MDFHSDAAAITLTSKELMSRGWTYRMIRAFLDAPDSVKRPPVGASGRPSACFSLERVRRVEKSMEFWRAKQLSRARANCSSTTFDRGQDSLTRYAETIELRLDDEPLDSLLEKARLAFNAQRPVRNHSSIQSGSHELAVAMLLHKLEVFDKYLDIYKWHSGIVAARDVFLARKLELIGAMYPALSAAAARLIPDPDAGETVAERVPLEPVCAADIP